MSELSEFETLASKSGIVLPDLLRNLLATGNTVYGSDWVPTWRERSLQGKAPFISWYDFEWVEASDARGQIKEWLNPDCQNGKTFLPFAQSGAGDAYCLMPINEKSVGVALIFHDDDTGRIGYRSFDDFVAVRFLETFANLDHHTDDFSEKEILQCVKSDVFSVTDLMDLAMRDYLRAFCDCPLVSRQFRYGLKSQARDVISLISQEQLDIELARFQPPDINPFTVLARWEINPPLKESVAVQPVLEAMVNWRTYAKNQNQKLVAIQSYREEFGVSLAEAKIAIDQYIDSTLSD